MQATLTIYESTNPNTPPLMPKDLFSELSECGYVEGHKRSLLILLWDLRSHSLPEIMSAGGSQYNARILELRREGWDIVNERSLQPVKSFYRLQSHTRRWEK